MIDPFRIVLPDRPTWTPLPPLRTYLLDDHVIVVSPRHTETPAAAHHALDEATGYATELGGALGLRWQVIVAPRAVEFIDQRADEGKTASGASAEG